jgi:hypothetical protein
MSHVNANRPADEQQPTASQPKYPLLEALLSEKGLVLKGSYTYRDLEDIFGASKRALQDWVRDGKLPTRDLPGRAHWLSVDLEDFLRNSMKNRSSSSEVKPR